MKTPDTNTHESPSGKFTLEVSSRDNGAGYWRYTKGVVRIGEEVLFEVDRNYSSFPFCFVENHPSTGHDYLVCGSDYQGQTVLDLTNGTRIDADSEGKEKGHGFCWVDYEFDEQEQLLIVSGCHWACPFEVRLYDFSDPKVWPQIGSDEWIEDGEKKPLIKDNGNIVVYETRYVELDDSLTDEELDAMEDDEEEVVVTKEFRREGLNLVLVDEWVDPEEKKRRDAAKLAREARDAALTLYRETNPMYLHVKNEVESNAAFSTSEKFFRTGWTYEGWCPHFDGEDTRTILSLARKVGPEEVTIELEMGRTIAPVKLVVYKNEDKSEDLWFDHSLNGVTAALITAENILTRDN